MSLWGTLWPVQSWLREVHTRPVWWLTRSYASEPKMRSSFLQATEERILRFESLSGRTSKGTPGSIREAFIHSVP